MATITYDQMVQTLQESLNSTTAFSAADYLNAYNKAVKDTGFTLPNSDDYQQIWIENRMCRHLFYFKKIRSLESFDVPKAKLEQQYQHYKEIVEEMDATFLAEKTDNPEKYGLDGASAFGEVASSGFLRDPLTGNDLTYTDSNDGVLINGKDSYGD